MITLILHKRNLNMEDSKKVYYIMVNNWVVVYKIIHIYLIRNGLDLDDFIEERVELKIQNLEIRDLIYLVY